MQQPQKKQKKKHLQQPKVQKVKKGQLHQNQKRKN
jgi:hypothetical protein